MVLGGLLRGSDEAADAAQKGISFADDSYRGRLAAHGVDEAINLPVKMTDSAGSTLAQTAKYGAGGAVGTSGIYFGSQAYQDRNAREEEQARQKSAQDFAETADAILNNDNLTPEQKQEALQRLEAMANDALDTDGGGPMQWWKNLGMIEKIIVGLVVVAIIRAVLKRWGDS